MYADRRRGFYYLSIIILLCLICAISLYQNYYQRALLNNLKQVKVHEKYNKELELASKVRILCLIPFNYMYPAAALLAKRTWTRNCNRVLFVSGNANAELEPFVPHRNCSDPWTLVREGFIHAYNYHRHEADWFLKVTDLSFVVLENLRYMLRNVSTQLPVYYGCKIKDSKGKPFMYGPAGYVLSKEALRRFASKAVKNEVLCKLDKANSEDYEMGRCLRSVAVIAADSRDAYGYQRFVPFPLETHYAAELKEEYRWFYNGSYYEIVNQSISISKNAITFEIDYSPKHISYYYYIYKIKNFGVLD